MEEISQVVKNYYAVIGQKDEDIFELYKDNKRLQKQLDEVLTAEEERETQLRTLQLLIAAIQAELREKQILIEAHQIESSNIRSALDKAREILKMPSELDYTAEDVIDACINLHNAYHALQFQYKNLLNSESTAWLLTHQIFIEAEEQGRRALEDAYETSTIAIFQISLHVLMQTTIEERRIHEMYTASELQWRRDLEIAEKRAVMERHQHTRVIEELQEKIINSETRLQLLERELCEGQSEREMLMEVACSRIDLMVERAADVDRILAIAFRNVIRGDKKLEETRKEVVNLNNKIEKLQNTLSRTRTLLRRKQQQNQNQNQREQSKLDISNNYNDVKEVSSHTVLLPVDVREALRVLQVEYDSLKSEWRKCVERERALRHQTSSTINKLKTEVSSSSTATEESKRRCELLEKALNRTRLEAKKHAKEVKQLEELLKSVRNESETQAELIRNLQEKNRILQEDNTLMVNRLQQQVEDMNIRIEKCNSEENTARGRIAALQLQLKQEKEGFLTELKEWTCVMEDARKKLNTAESERDREKMLRSMLVEQHRDEERLMKKLMTEEHEREMHKLKEKINILEKACKRSVNVIAGLREKIHRITTVNSESNINLES